MLDKNANWIADVKKQCFNFDEEGVTEVLRELHTFKLQYQRVEFSNDDFKSPPQILQHTSDNLQYIRMFFLGFLYVYAQDSFYSKLNFQITIFESDNEYCGEIQYQLK